VAQARDCSHARSVDRASHLSETGGAGAITARVTGWLRSHLDPGRDASGSIYGTIITAATIVGVAEGTHNVLDEAITVVATLVLYWIAHSYAQLLGRPRGGTPSWTAAWHELAAEWQMVAVCVLPLAGLLVAGLLGASFSLATSIALWLSVGLLFLWGLLAARRAGQGAGAQLLSSAVFAVLGIAIVVLKSLLVH
jgi:hypothetical protein